MTARMPPAASASARLRVTLPSGLWRQGVHWRRAVLRPLTGSDEEALLESSGEAPAVRVSRLLGRCLLALEAADGSSDDSAGVPAGDAGLGSDLARRLSVGDREALLLHLRRLTFGDALDAVLDCPQPECGERMDLTLAAGDLLLSPYAAPRPVYATTAPVPAPGEASGAAGRASEAAGEGGAWGVRFRLPTGADQEAAAERLAADGAEAAVELLARRCLVALRAPDGEELLAETDDAPRPGGALADRELLPDVPADLPPQVLTALSVAIAEADPQAELLLRLTCPECGEPFSSRFDSAAYLFAELSGGATAGGTGLELYRQVHALALHYHWSEAEVLTMTPRKRRLYLALLADDSASLAAATGGALSSGAAA